MNISIYSVAPVCAGLPFAGIGIFGTWAIGPHPLLLSFALLGLFSVSVGMYYAIFQIDFRQGKFVVTPGRKRYDINDVVAWRTGEDSDSKIGYRRHIELRFDRWYRRYMLLEDRVTPKVFDFVLAALKNKKKTETKK